MRRDEQGDKQRRRTIHDQLAAQGLTHPDDIAAAFRREWPALGPMAAFRLVHEISQPMAAARYNDATGRRPGDPKRIGRKDVSRLELWPGHGGHGGDVRKPTAGELVVFARIYGASSPCRLVEAEHWPLLDPADRAALRPHGADAGPDAGGLVPAGRSQHHQHHQHHPAQHAPAASDTRDTGTDRACGPASLERFLVMAAHESAGYGDHPSNIGPFTLDQLRADVTTLARSFANAPRLRVFSHARFLRDHAFALLDGRQRIAESRDLYFLAGATCGMLAEISEDLGNSQAAMTHARTGLLCAKEADHGPLTAWLLAEQSIITYRDDRPAQAVRYARQGQEHATDGSIRLKLLSVQARATGALTETAETRDALAQATAGRHQFTADDLDGIGGILSFSAAKQHFYASDAYLGIGDSSAVIPNVEACVQGYQSGPADERAHDNESLARINQAAAHLLPGTDQDVEAASVAARAAMTIPPDLRIAEIDRQLRRLNRRLSTADLRTTPHARDLRESIEDFLSTPPALPGPVDA